MYLAPAFEKKICDPAQLIAHVAVLPRLLVFTNGVFDLLHRGHVTYLAQARALGASLVVAINSDTSARALEKEPGRPLNICADRMAVLAALESVTLVTWFEEVTPLRLINLLKPDVLVKGGDWRTEQIVGAAEAAAWGGSVYSIPFVHSHSTTALVAKIRG